MAISITTQPAAGAVIPVSECAEICIAGTASAGTLRRRTVYWLEKNGNPATNTRSLVSSAVCKRLDFMADAKHLVMTRDAPFAIAGDWQPDGDIFDWFVAEFEEYVQDTDDCSDVIGNTVTSNSFGVIASKPSFLSGNPFAGAQAVVLSDRPRCYTIQRETWDAIWVHITAATDVEITSYTATGAVIDTSTALAINHNTNPVIVVGTSLLTVDAVHASAARLRIRITTSLGSFWNNGADRIDYNVYFHTKCEALDVYFREPFGAWSVITFKDFEFESGLDFESFKEKAACNIDARRTQQSGRYNVQESFIVKFRQKFTKNAEMQRFLAQLRWSTAAKIRLNDRFGTAYYQAITINPSSIFIKPFIGVLEVEFEAEVVWVV